MPERTYIVLLLTDSRSDREVDFVDDVVAYTPDQAVRIAADGLETQEEAKLVAVAERNWNVLRVPPQQG